jgi:hypothetical protein
MKYLKITNDGVLDIRLVALMGGTTKNNDKYKIGQFGTGLKYTLAFLFRNNLEFKIMAGTDEVKIHIEKETIRNEDFEIICINGQRTSITTKMGEDWEAWMIIRELWCNALDEGGAVKEITEDVTGEDGKTSFYIQVDKQVQTVLNNWNKYFIHEQQPVFSDGTFALYPAGDHLTLYKQGVLIHEDKNQKSVFSYDLGIADINELREYRGSVSHAIVQILSKSSEDAARYFLENVNETHYEGSGNMDYEWWSSWGEAWKNVIGTGKIIYQKVLDDIRARGGHPDETGLIVVPKCVYKALTKQFEGVGALRVASKINDFFEAYSEATESKVKQALTILEHCEYPMHPELTFVFGFFEDKTVQARIDLDKKKIYVSNALIQQPLFTIVAMLVEENEHFNTGMSDETRQFQQHFTNLYTRQLLAGREIEI